MAQLRQLVQTQRAFLLPVIKNYVDAPDPAKWEQVKQWSRNVYGLIKVGIRSVLTSKTHAYNLWHRRSMTFSEFYQSAQQ